jgi:hypothetical protein
MRRTFPRAEGRWWRQLLGGTRGRRGCELGRVGRKDRWAFMGCAAEKPPGLAQDFRAGRERRLQWAEMCCCASRPEK